MKDIEKLTLIDGVFSTEEAKEILMSIFTSKINFHNIKNWSSNERFGKDDESAQRRIPALKNEIENLQIILSKAKANNKKLVVTSEINIALSDH